MAYETRSGYTGKLECPFYYSKLLKKNVYTKVEIEPEFPGGEAAYQRFLNKNLLITEDPNDDVTSLPIPKMNFIVDTDGQIINPCIDSKYDTTQFNCLEKAAWRLIKKMPRWQPGVCEGKEVAVEITRPVAICLLWKTE
ncbi:hypothetical protein A3860_28040 [Niastella vici]|uniref:TonB C-terminal domain-containing protein n=2 Tax=Niastella vici TaxID=1703345 RepID=A0A1V9FW41_9BACT|nr:hypothetical protein A3860_28040 [Niastella vici]